MAIYPLPKFHFTVDWGGKKIGFTEVSGLDFQVELIEYRSGESKEFHKIKMPGMQKFSNITFKRGTFKDNEEFYAWVKLTSDLAAVERRDITISLLDEKHQPVMTWSVKNAFPIKWQPSDFKADGNETAIETLEIAHEGLTSKLN